MSPLLLFVVFLGHARWRHAHILKFHCWCAHASRSYDHLLEWQAQGSYYLAPDVPRVSQWPGKGMTYAENPVNAIHEGWVAATDFVVENGYDCQQLPLRGLQLQLQLTRP